ncbi:hypothetical protein [Streptomyces sp. LBL]|uniref:hypothetical protein n=1 Tax=Streptomyces sp. LBL TaxID=2940562 RepID=UPI002476B297|nr:hypothetical protein [Streptomyces sp. LBL]
MLPEAVRAPWQPVLALLEEKYGPPAELPGPVVKITSWVESYGGLPLEAFTARVQADGVAAAVAELAATPVPLDDEDEDGDGARAALLGELATQDPDAWAADPTTVATAAARPALQTAYFNALHHAAAGGRLGPGLLGPLAEAAFAVRPQEAGVPHEARLQLVISNLLHRLWNSGASLGGSGGGRRGLAACPHHRLVHAAPGHLLPAGRGHDGAWRQRPAVLDRLGHPARGAHRRGTARAVPRRWDCPGS